MFVAAARGRRRRRRISSLSLLSFFSPCFSFPPPPLSLSLVPLLSFLLSLFLTGTAGQTDKQGAGGMNNYEILLWFLISILLMHLFYHGNKRRKNEGILLFCSFARLRFPKKGIFLVIPILHAFSTFTRIMLLIPEASTHTWAGPKS